MESPNTNIGRQSFRHRSAIVWNNIPHWVKNIEDYHKFKSKLCSCSVAVGNISFNDSAFVSNKDLRNFKYFIIILGYILWILVLIQIFCN